MTTSWTFLLERPEIVFSPSLLKSVFFGKSIVITGAAGSVGTALSHLVQDYRPERLILVDAHEASLVRLSREFDSTGAGDSLEFVLGDVRDRRKIKQILRRCRVDYVFHLAAYKQVPLGEANSDQVLDVNILGTVNVMECARETGVSTVIYPSTDKSVSPSSLYGASKRVVERYLHATALESSQPGVRIVRLVNVFGTQGSVVELFAHWIEADQPIGITDPTMDRYWITMGEATQLLAVAAGRKQFEGIHLLDVGAPVPIIRTATTLYRRLRPDSGEPAIRILGVRPGERFHEYLSYPDERLAQTDLAGLLVLNLPTPTVSAAAWTAELQTLAARLYDVEPAHLRAWLLDVTSSQTEWDLRADLRAGDAGRYS